MRGSWRLNKDCNILTSPAPSDIAVRRSCSPGLNRRPGDPLCWLSLLHLITSWSGLVPKLHRGSRGPLLLVGGFAYHDFDSNSSDLQLTDFLFSPSYIIVQSPTQSLEWHVWSSSIGNNCHTVQRSLSSGASVYECIMGFHLVPFRQSNPPTRLLAIGMCHFLPVRHFGMACLAGSKVNIQQSSLNYFSKFHMWDFLRVCLHHPHMHILQNDLQGP